MESEESLGGGIEQWTQGPAQLPAGLARQRAGPKGQTREMKWGTERGLSSGLRSAALAHIELAEWSGHATRAQPAATVTSSCARGPERAQAERRSREQARSPPGSEPGKGLRPAWGRLE